MKLRKLTRIKVIKKHSNPTVIFMKLINILMRKGLKVRMINLILTSFMYIKKLTKKSPLVVLIKVLKSISLCVELKSIRRGSTQFLIPTPVSGSRQNLFAIKNLLANAKSRSESTSLAEKLANEIFETYSRSSKTYKQTLDFYKLIKEHKDNYKLCKVIKYKSV
jgi:small subunit ribosomal protein S7